MELTLNSEEITLLISYESQKVENWKCKIDDKVGDILKQYASQIHEDFSKLYILYGGKALQGADLEKSFSSIISSFDKLEKTMNILIYLKIASRKKTDLGDIKVILIIDSKSPFIMQGKRDEPLKDIYNRYNQKIGLDINKLSFKYGIYTIDYNKTFNEIANSSDKICGGITISVYTTNTRNPLKVNFIYNNNRFTIEGYKENKVGDICHQFCSKINKNMYCLFFKYEGKDINFDQTFSQLLSSIITYNNTSERLNPEQLIKNIDITVFEPTPSNSKSSKTKNILIILAIIILIIIIIIVVIVVVTNNNNNNKKEEEEDDSITQIDPTIDTTKVCTEGYFVPKDDPTSQDCQKCSIEGCANCTGTYAENECLSCGDLKTLKDSNDKIIKCLSTCDIGPEEKCLTCDSETLDCTSCNIGYKLVDGLCKPKFLIKAIYQTTADGDTIKLINSAFISLMIIDGEEVTTSNYFQFQKAGNHTVYLNFRHTSAYISHSGGLFENIPKLISVTFSDYDESRLEIAFRKMFRNSVNLISVDMSKLSLDMNFYMDEMFYGCTRLVNVNINRKKLIASGSLEYMFYNCKSLTSVDFSKINATTISNFNHMFEECNSLKRINFDGFNINSAETIQKMFYNCYSLEFIDLSSFQPKKLNYMDRLFYNCSSLTSINLTNFYTSQVRTMDYTFYNCTSLKYLDLSSFNTENVQRMFYMFSHCHSLTSINFGNNFNTDNVNYMDSFFSHCYSLKRIDYPISISESIYNLTEFFYNCHSLTSVNFEKFKTDKISRYEYMFYNCYNLKSIDTTNFDFKNAQSTSFMFAGCYSLTSLDLSKSSDKYISNINGMFNDCPNLSFIDFSFVTNTYLLTYFNENISATGTIVLKNSYNIEDTNKIKIPEGWEAELV